MKTLIRDDSADPQRPYAHLQPLVDALLDHGNALRDGRAWYQDRDGWRLDLRDPVDFDVIHRHFDLPKTIRCAPAQDAILCELSWIEISGGRAASAQ